MYGGPSAALGHYPKRRCREGRHNMRKVRGQDKSGYQLWDTK